MARKPLPAEAEPEMIPHPTFGFAGVKPESRRPWQPVPLGQVKIEAPPEGAGGVANLSETAQTEIREAHEAEQKDSE